MGPWSHRGGVEVAQRSLAAARDRSGPRPMSSNYVFKPFLYARLPPTFSFTSDSVCTPNALGLPPAFSFTSDSVYTSSAVPRGGTFRFRRAFARRDFPSVPRRWSLSPLETTSLPGTSFPLFFGKLWKKYFELRALWTFFPDWKPSSDDFPSYSLKFCPPFFWNRFLIRGL